MERRDYQANIAEVASGDNTLVVLPTGLGKTFVAILVAEKRLAAMGDGKVLVLAPTRPLVIQHYKAFTEHFRDAASNHMTGQVPPEMREKLWVESKFVFATPQVIANDIRKERYSLRDVCLMVFDEAHRCVKDYDYTDLARKYQQNATNPLILGLTASPGGRIDRVQEICANLFIKQVEARSEYDDDVRPYVQSVALEWKRVPLPESYRTVSSLLRAVYGEKVLKLKAMKVLPDTEWVTKRLLLDLRQRLIVRLKERRSGYIFAALTLQAQAISLLHGIELLETQGAENLEAYLTRMSQNPKRTIKSLMKDERVQRAIQLTTTLDQVHPKLPVVQALVSEEMKSNPDGRIIVFTQYRDTVDQIVSRLNQPDIRPVRFVGQATRDAAAQGLTQKTQVEILDKFRNGDYNVLVTTSIGEEGLHVPDVDHVVFYEAVPSEIRTIQRRGRTGRTRFGKVTVLMAEDTVDEAYYYSSLRKERRMHSIMSMVKAKGVKAFKKKTTLLDYT